MARKRTRRSKSSNAGKSNKRANKPQATPKEEKKVEAAEPVVEEEIVEEEVESPQEEVEPVEEEVAEEIEEVEAVEEEPDADEEVEAEEELDELEEEEETEEEILEEEEPEPEVVEEVKPRKRVARRRSAATGKAVSRKRTRPARRTDAVEAETADDVEDEPAPAPRPRRRTRTRTRPSRTRAAAADIEIDSYEVDEEPEAPAPAPAPASARRLRSRRRTSAAGEGGRRFQFDNPADESEPEGILDRISELLNVDLMRRRVGYRERGLFCRQLSSLLSAGVPLVRSLRLLSERQGANPTLKSAGFDVARDIEAGESLGDALAEHPEAFDELFVGVVNQGEAAGILEEALQRLGDVYENKARIRRRIIASSTYPIILIITAAIVVAVIMIKIVPIFTEFFDEAGKPLPPPTQIVVGISNHLVAFWPLWLIVIVVGGIGLRILYNNSEGSRVAWERTQLRLPKIGQLVRLINSARLSRTLSNLISSGIPLWEALGLAARTSESVLVNDSLEECAENIEQGRKLEPALAESPCFTPEFVDVVGIGEETGRLDMMLTQLAGSYEEEVELRLDSLLELVKPILLIIFALMIFIILLAVYLPYFRLVSTINEG